MSMNNGVSSRDSVANMIKILVNQKNGIKICHINAQSLKGKIDEFRFIFENSFVDFICVSETWFDSTVTDSFVSLYGYNLCRVDRDDGYGGVAIYIRKGITFTVKCSSKEKDLFEDCETLDNINLVEYLFIEVNSEGRKILVGSVYRPNRTVNTTQFMRSLEVLSAMYEDILIAGDFNSNVLEDNSLLYEFSSLGLVLPNKTVPTHFTASTCTLLDLFLVGNESNILIYDQLSVPCFSKHDLIFMTYRFHLSTPAQTFTFRDFKNVNIRLLEQEFRRIEWNNVYYIDSVDDQLSFFEHNINNLMDLTVPLKTKYASNTRKPWFSTEIKELINQRDAAYNRWKRFRTEELRKVYLVTKTKVNRRIKRAKSEFYAEKFSHVLSSKKTWQTIRELGVGNIVSHERCSVDADVINQKFLSIPAVEADQTYYNNFPRNSSDNIFSFKTVDQCDVVASLLSIKSNSVGVDGINPRFIKILLPMLLPYITFIFNKIITSSQFPSKWKVARIIPIPKTRSEYRPIAILPYLSKVLERIMHNQITHYLNNNNLLSDRQSGFRQKQSCITALVEVAEEIRKQVDDGRISFLVLLDHSKAFDTVDHNILCFKLGNFFNFSPTATLLIHTYLSKRYQYVETLFNSSETLPIIRGVPQGSIVGPLLFSMYSNDLPNVLNSCNIRMYADDVQLFTSCTYDMIDQCVTSLNQELLRIHNWATANGLAINPRKSKCIIVQKRLGQVNIHPYLHISDQAIEIVSSAKNLGVIFNKTLTWSDHVNYACGRTFFMLRTLWHTRDYTPIGIRSLIAKTYLIPVLLYGCELFASCDYSSQRKLNVTFNSIIRYVYGLKRRSRISMYSTQLFGISLDNLLKLRVLVFLHRIIYTREPEHLFSRLTITDNFRGKRIRTLAYRSLISKWNFFFFAISLWNSIPYSTQLLSNARHFRDNIVNLFSN